MTQARQLILLGVVILFGIGAVVYSRLNSTAPATNAALAPKILTVTAFRTGDWKYHKAQLDCAAPTCSTNFRTGTEVCKLNPLPAQWAFRPGKDVARRHDDAACADRAVYPKNMPARQAPCVIAPCASTGDSTFWHGALLSEWAARWANHRTQGLAPYGMVSGKETPLLTAVTHLAKPGRGDL